MFSQNPVDLDSAIETLKETTPRPEAAESARSKLTEEARRNSLAPRLLVVGSLVVLFVVFFPRREAVASWAGSLQASSRAVRIHRVVRNRQGLVVYENWRDGDNRAMVSRDPTGTVRWEFRVNASGYVIYDGFEAQRAARNPNARPGAEVHHVPGPFARLTWTEGDMIEDLTSRKDITVLEQRTDSNGTFYKLATKGKPSETMLVEVDTSTGRILRITSSPGGTDEVVEYPSKIDPDIFAPRLRAMTGLPTYDVDDEIKVATQRLRKPIAVRDGIELRIVLLDSKGHLTAFWTGATPDGLLSRPFKVPGVRLGQAYGTPAFTNSYKRAPESGPCPVIGARLGGMTREALTKISGTITLLVPGKHGYVEFRDVPIMRVGELGDLGTLLGMVRASRTP